jgi:hypothetical protein
MSAQTAYSPNQVCLTGRLGLVWRRDVWPGLVRWSLRRQVINAGWRVYLHRFVVLDSDLHNHPWRWCCSLLVRGHYTEEFCDCSRGEPTPPPPERLVSRVVRWVNYIPLRRWHRITGLPADGRAVWTLVVCGPSTLDQEGNPVP